jgi:hypothetical protein
MSERCQAFFDAARFGHYVLGSDAVAAAWDGPSALPRMSVAAVAGHMFLALRVTQRYLDAPPPTSDVALLPLGGWYGQMRLLGEHDLDATPHRTIRADGQHVGSRGRLNVVDRYERLLAGLEARADDMVTDRGIQLGMTDTAAPARVTALSDLLATRIVELLVHADDLACSAHLPEVVLPSTAADVAMETLLELCRHRSSDVALLRAMTRAERADSDVMRCL